MIERNKSRIRREMKEREGEVYTVDEKKKIGKLGNKTTHALFSIYLGGAK